MATMTNQTPTPRVSRDRTLGIRASSAWQDWLARLAVQARVPASVVIDIALTNFAQDLGFDPPPPR